MRGMVEMSCRLGIINGMNKLKRYARMCSVLLLVGVLTFGCASALGKPNRSNKKRTTAPTIEASQPWLASVYAVVALAGVCVVAFKNPGRTHSD